MRHLLRLGAITLALGACAPAQSTIPARAPAPAAPPAAPPPATAEAQPDGPPPNWWLLDEASDRVRGISLQRAYGELIAGRQPKRSVVVAIIDSGVEVDHPDLRASIWTNSDEVAGNGRDDDRNGYTDDVHGWNFIGGPDGRNVDQDTYEFTRIYARLRPRYETARADTLSAAARAEFELFQRARAELEPRRGETSQTLAQLRNISRAVDRTLALLRQHFGTDSVTVAQVQALRTDRPDLRQAQTIFLQMAEHGITPAAIQSDIEMLEESLQYHLNPDFDPRPIVGDNYADLNERIYGNPEVEGPDASHGTHVAGIVAAGRGNGIGADGIAEAARIMSIRAVPDGDERDKDVANAIRYAVDNGAHIINMSFGKGFSPEKAVVDAAVRYAEEKGVLLVHGAGNDARDLEGAENYPNPYYLSGDTARNWIEVGATSWQGADSLVADFSNYGRRQVDVFAPGVDIMSTVPDAEFDSLSGTSMAAPVVSGVAALLMSHYPDLTAVQVKRIILESATRYADQQVLRPGGEGGRVRFGELSATGGVVNAYAALKMAEQLSPQSPN